MKTPTLIVRLLGIYLICSYGLGLLQLSTMNTTVLDQNGARVSPPFVEHIAIAYIVGIVTGVAATAFAGPLARLLTFDSEPNRRLQLSDHLLAAGSQKPNSDET
jgi:hypothetical protein